MCRPKLIQLYQCFEAKVKHDIIYCAKGHRLNDQSRHGNIEVNRLRRGMPLICKVCQDCLDCDWMGEQVEKQDRGWL